MASSSSSHHQNQEFNAFYGIEPPGNRWKSSESSKLFDVFINHRGPDVKQTLATQLYVSLEQLGIRAFLDSQEKELGNSFPSIIKTAIRSAKVHIAIFSKRYAESPWCLAELVQMLESKAKIIPVFYEVEPWELRYIERGSYAAAFIQYEDKGRYLEKLSEWKEALQTLSFIAGEEFHSFSDCHKIVAAVRKEAQRKARLPVAQHPVGLNNLVKDFERKCLDKLVQDFENQCGLEERRHKPNIVGIFGMGGSGKTTLAKELFNRKRSNFSRASFLFDVREASVKNELLFLQSQLLKDLFNEDQGFRSIEEGTSYLNDCLQSSPFLNFLIVVDDIDHMEQLNALLVRDILNISGNSLIIVTTRDVGVVITAGITVGYRLTGMDTNHGRELFCWHAFGQSHPRAGYEALVDQFVDVCGGLPLSLQVLGRHIHGRNHSYWMSVLTKAKTTLPRDVKQRLRISFESLDDQQKQVFMDTACFFIGKPKSIAERVWEGSGWNAQHALEALKDKCLVEETKIRSLNIQGEIVLRMHDHLRDLEREMAHELSPPHRLWRPQDLLSLKLMGFKTILAKTDVRCFNSIFDESMGSQVTFFLGQSDSCVETSASLLWLQIEVDSTELPSIPSWIPLQKLQYFEIEGGRFKTLWENGMQLPSQLKELQISLISLKEFPDFSGISDNLENALLDARGTPFTGLSSSVRAPMNGLEKLEITHEECVSKIIISGMHYPSLRSIKLHYMEELVEVDLRMVKTLNYLEIRNCENLKKVSGISDLEKLVELIIYDCGKLEFEYLCLRGMKCLERITFDRNVVVKCFELDGCQKLKITELPFEKLVKIRIQGCPELKEIPELQEIPELKQIPELKEITVFSGPSWFEGIIIDGCEIQDLQLSGCKNLRSASGISDLAEVVELEISGCGKLEFESLFNYKKLVVLRIRGCPKLEEMPDFIGLSCLQRIIIDDCGIQVLRLFDCQNLRSVSGNFQFTRLYIKNCPQLEELPSLSRLLKEIVIDSCEKLENIAGIEELHVQEYMRLRYCGNAIIRSWIHKLKSVPSEGMDMIGRAVDGAESSLNPNLGVDGVFVTGTDLSYSRRSKMSLVIGCFVVVIDSSTLAEDINKSLPYVYSYRLKVGQWIITLVACNYWISTYYMRVEDVLRRKGIMKKGLSVEFKEGEEWKGVEVLRTIVDRFYCL